MIDINLISVIYSLVFLTINEIIKVRFTNYDPLDRSFSVSLTCLIYVTALQPTIIIDDSNRRVLQ